MSTNQRQDGLWTVRFGELGATLKAFQDNGVTKKELARLRAEPNYAKRVAEFMLQDGVVNLHHKSVRAIMSKNFFGVDEWLFFYGVNFSKKQLREVAKFPWSEDILNAPCPFHKGKSIKETHFAFLGLDTFKGKPLNILKWQELHPATSWPKFDSYASESWYNKEKFSNESICSFRWYLMPLEIPPDFTDKTYQEQVAMLPVNYEVPSVVEEVTKIILYYRKNNVCLSPTRSSRCRDTASDGSRIYVNCFASVALSIYSCLDNLPRWDIGIAASRKFPN